MGARIEQPIFQAFDANGDPLSSGLLYSYIAGTDTEKALYYDKTLATPASNPVIINSSGYTQNAGGLTTAIYGSGTYKLVLKTSAGVTLWTLDNVTGIGGGEGGEYASDYGCDLAAAVAAIGSDEVTLTIDCDVSVAADLTCPATLNLRFIRGSVITVATTKTLTIGNVTDPGGFQIFSLAGTGQVVFDDGATDIVRPEWFGAVADGDGGTDSGPALLAAINAASDRSMVKLLGEYYNAATTLAFGSTKFIQFLGPAKIFYGSTGKCISIAAGVSAIREKHRFADLVLQPSSGNERSNAAQIGIYAEDSTKCVFERVWVLDFKTNWELWNASGYCENNTFITCKSQGGQIGWLLDGAGSNKSFATNTWIQCNIALAGADNGAIGFKVSQNANIYRSYLGLQIHNKSLENGICFYHDGDGAGVQGHVDMEGDSSTGSVGWKIGPNVTSMNWNALGDVRGIETEIVFEAGSPAISGVGKFESNSSMTLYRQAGILTPLPYSIQNEDESYVYKNRISSSENYVQQVLQAKRVQVSTLEDVDVRGTHEAVHVGNTATITDQTDTTPSVKGLEYVTLTPGGALEVTYTTFDDGVTGQKLVVIAGNALVTIHHDAAVVRLASHADFAMGAEDTLTLLKTAGGWRELARCVV